MSVKSLRYSDLSLRVPKGTSALPIERDAWAFLDAAGITSALQQRAVVQLVRDLKKAKLWTKMKAVYPFVGGTATTHKWNLKDPQDTNGAFRLTFNGGWTHSSTGALPNGTNGYANTYIKPKTDMAIGSGHGSVYVRTNPAAGERADYSTNGGVSNSSFSMYVKFSISGGSALVDFPTFNPRILAANADARGMYVASRTSTTVFKAFRNGQQLGNTSTNTASQAAFDSLDDDLFLAAQNQFAANIIYYSDREYAFFSFGEGLADAEAKLLYECVDRYQKTLGRAV